MYRNQPVVVVSVHVHVVGFLLRQGKKNTVMSTSSILGMYGLHYNKTTVPTTAIDHQSIDTQKKAHLIWPAWFPLQSLAVNRKVFSTNWRAFLAESSLESKASWLLALREWNNLASSDMGSSLNGEPAGYCKLH